ncbi:hypothetical protein HYH02_011311 [Chlamydomonas schloesseri]|uniref:RNA helicase n=1 Tax=Chlamydomonas schloesseri TaxID=2026947 RepID=A0A835W2N6_9CHLO|nr:hypothetical protein HYH02_011311 [Chlamydomonas schloesseri]|eukprot:KAG2437050.1 hypothetical protein HYH02_011311 [Chlamydomonas schloesseri]
MTKTSKRQQKNKQSNTCRSKAGGDNSLAGLDLLSDELRQQYEDAGINAADLLIASGPKQKGAKQGGGKAAEPEPELSKSQLRKLKQVQLKKERRENLSQVLATLNEHAASDSALALLRPLHQRGHRETKKQRLRRELQLQRAGIAPAVAAAAAGDGAGGGGGSSSELLRRRRVGRAEDMERSDDSEEEEEEDGHGDEDEELVKGGPAGAADDSGSGSEEDDQKPQPVVRLGPQQPQPQPKAAVDPEVAAAAAAAARKEAMRAAKKEAERIRAQELGGAVPAVQDESLGDGAEVAAARRQAAAAAAEAAHWPHRVVHVTRPAAITAARLGLPISGMEADIMEAVAAHDVIVLAGETGCGKTTQVPQFLLEAGYGCKDFPERAGAVGITQPRRVAAVSTAQRVAEELGCAIGEAVGYQVRYDRSVGSGTALKFMTDGILLRELQLDFSLSAYSAIIVDEAHERALNTDLLLGMLSRIVPLRRRLWRQRQEALARGEAPPPGPPVYPLKLIVMSATLRTSDFTENKRLFDTPPPVINVPARQFPVTVHFSRRTEMTDYVSAAFRKVTRIHAELPPGGVLVFLTGQREVEGLCKRLRGHYAAQRARRAAAGSGSGRPAAGAGPGGGGGGGGGDDGDGDGDGSAAAEGEEEEEEELVEQYGGGGGDGAEVAGDAAERRRRGGDAEVDDYGEMNGDDPEGDEDEEEVVVMGGDQFTPEEIAEAERRFEETYGRQLPGAAAVGAGAGAAGGAAGGGDKGAEAATGAAAPVYVLPLYAMLPQARQAKVFAPHPPGSRLIIVATNVAETSLTIPGIRYVVDAGRSKQKLLEDTSGGQVARYEVRWISKASASQRAGRAGRTCPGHAYRLFSSAHFNDTFPEHSPPEIVNTSLEGTVLVMKAMGVDRVHNFPFPTPPEPAALLAAHKCLEALGALSPGGGRLTDIGRAMAAFPISPRHARMLLEVLRWHKSLSAEQEGEQDSGAGSGAAAAAAAAAGPLSVPEAVARRAGRALPYAVALAAAVSVESPFIHIDTVGGGDDGGGGSGGRDQDDAAADDEDDPEDGGAAGARGKRAGGKAGRGGDVGKKQPKKVRRGSGGGGRDDYEEEEEDGGGDEDEEEEERAGPGPSSAARRAAAAAAKEASRRKREAAAALQARFRHPHSDALSALAALVAFEAAGEDEEFAARHFLHGRNLREAADLHKQLLRMLALQQVRDAAGGGSGAAAAGGEGGGALAEELAAAAKEIAAAMALAPDARSSKAQAAAAARAAAAAAAGAKDVAGATAAALLPERVTAVLRRALAAGWADQVARRVRSAEYLKQLGESRRKHHAVRYQPACLPDPGDHVFLHPRSALHGSAPELVVYGGLLRTDKRPYMAGLTAIEPEWLTESGTPLCVLSEEPLADPPPAYRGGATDAVVAYREARYGLHGWALPPVAAPHPAAAERAAVFGAALLEGRVLPALADLRPHLAASPAMLLRPELRGVARVGELVGALTRAHVDSRSSLAAAWRQQPGLLQRELSAWVTKSQQGALLRMWPRLLEQAAAPAAGAGGAAGRGGAGRKEKAKVAVVAVKTGAGAAGSQAGAGKGQNTGKKQQGKSKSSRGF